MCLSMGVNELERYGHVFPYVHDVQEKGTHGF